MNLWLLDFGELDFLERQRRSSIDRLSLFPVIELQLVVLQDFFNSSCCTLAWLLLLRGCLVVQWDQMHIGLHVFLIEADLALTVEKTCRCLVLILHVRLIVLAVGRRVLLSDVWCLLELTNASTSRSGTVGNTSCFVEFHHRCVSLDI